MKKILFFSITFFLFLSVLLAVIFQRSSVPITGAPPYDASSSDYVTESEEEAMLRNWKRPEGPARVGLQVGHWKNDDVPEELHRLRGNTGATGGGKSEWEVNYAIAEKAAALLRAKGITVDILPATIPKAYWADVFVAVHADGNLDTDKSGYKAAAPRRDYTQKADRLVQSIEESYEKATGLVKDPVITRNMRGYYAFSWYRFEHATHPMTTSAILETGFLTNPEDREIIVSRPEISAQGLANGVLKFLSSEDLLSG